MKLRQDLTEESFHHRVYENIYRITGALLTAGGVFLTVSGVVESGKAGLEAVTTINEPLQLAIGGAAILASGLWGIQKSLSHAGRADTIDAELLRRDSLSTPIPTQDIATL